MLLLMSKVLRMSILLIVLALVVIALILLVLVVRVCILSMMAVAFIVLTLRVSRHDEVRFEGSLGDACTGSVVEQRDCAMLGIGVAMDIKNQQHK